MAVVAVAPCQCLWPGGHQMTSPARISTISSPSHCVQPQPAVTIRVWPRGWVCHALRAPGWKVTLAQETRAGAGGAFSGSIRTAPVKYSSGPLWDGCDPARFSSMSCSFGADTPDGGFGLKPSLTRAGKSSAENPDRWPADLRQLH